MAPLPALRVSYSHLFPGARLTMPHPPPTLPDHTVEATVILDDRVVVAATLTPADGGRHLLSVEPYTTAAGTTIRAKNWTVTVREHDSQTLVLGVTAPAD